ncbi:MAG TPA: type II toxin-antitoxin system VapB family antitoxin [Armatimonadota bacterium]|nr:type II toxin-antitoxin system VapB family antitoxin [Armatimonadota bacterium]
MRTTLDIPKELLEQVQSLAEAPTKKQAVVTALEEYVKSRLRERLLARLGTTKLNLTPEDLRDMREGRELPSRDEPMVLLGPWGGPLRAPKEKPDWTDGS